MEELVTALLLLARMDDEEAASTAAVDLDDLVLAEARRVRGQPVRASMSPASARARSRVTGCCWDRWLPTC